MVYSCDKSGVIPLNKNQKEFLASQYERSYNVTETESSIIEILPSSAVSHLDINSFSRIQLKNTEAITYPKIHFTDQHIYLTTNFASQEDSLIYVYSYNGSFVKKFGRYGRGPDEYERINDLILDRFVLYIADNMQIKIIDSSTGKEIRRKVYSNIYPQNLYSINDKLFITTPFNHIFPFSINIISKDSFEIENTLIDNREGPFNYKLAKSVFITQAENKIIYSRKGFNTLIFIDIDNYNSSAVAEILYEPLKLEIGLLGEEANQEKMDYVFSTVSTIEDIHYSDGRIFLKIYDASLNQWVLGVIDSDFNSDKWIMNMFTLDKEFFFNNHDLWILISTMDSFESGKELENIVLASIALESL